ncbi:uridine kinase [Marinomonas sp. 2405UD68-3]|uniref:uridine kinase n=1 Tax=Marinomonas sp. 2405UD68-3 TaxID=3391835 RepID=UPI0039C9D4CD
MTIFQDRAHFLKMMVISFLLFFCVTSGAFNEDAGEKPEPKVYSKEAELFGLKINNLSQSEFEGQLKKMGLNSFPSFRKGIASYSLGEEGILGVRSLTVVYNKSKYIEKIVLVGVVKSNEKRKALGSLLINKYGAPTVGFVNQGFGMAQWLFGDGTLIELRNTTFDVSMSYVDRSPKVPPLSGEIDVELLQKKIQSSK